MIPQGSQVILVEASSAQAGHPVASVTWKLLEEGKPGTCGGPQVSFLGALAGG